MLDRVLTVANILLEQALGSPETIRINVDAQQEALRSPLVEKIPLNLPVQLVPTRTSP